MTKARVSSVDKRKRFREVKIARLIITTSALIFTTCPQSLALVECQNKEVKQKKTWGIDEYIHTYLVSTYAVSKLPTRRMRVDTVRGRKRSRMQFVYVKD